MVGFLCISLEKLAEATRKFNELQLEIANAGSVRLQRSMMSLQQVADLAEREDNNTGNTSNSRPVVTTRRRKPMIPKPSVAVNNVITKTSRKLKDLKVAVTEFYLSLILIQNFQVSFG